MNLHDRVQALDGMLSEGKFGESAEQYFAKGVQRHTQGLIGTKGKSALDDYRRLDDLTGGSAAVHILGQRVLEDDRVSVTVLSIEADGSGGEDDDASRVRRLVLLARRWNDKGEVVEEEYLPIGSTADAQAYFPDERLPNKQVQPRLSFVTPTRKRRGGRTGGRPRKPIAETDLHRLPQVGKTVVAALQEAGVTTFQTLSEATDDLLDSVRSTSGPRFRNFDFTYWRKVAGYAVRGEWDKMPPPPKVQKASKRGEKVDLASLRDGDVNRIPKVGPGLYAAMQDLGLDSFTALADATDEQLEELRQRGGRPFVNFDMTYFRTVGQRKRDGAKSMPAPPKPEKPGAAGTGGKGRQPRPINPSDIHKLPGVGAQLVAALHERGIVTFQNIADAARDVLAEARAQTRGKYKNIDLGFLQKQAKYAAEGKFDKLDKQVKIEKAAKPVKVDARERQLNRLRNASAEDISALPGIGKSVREAMAARGITTFDQLAKANDDTLREVAANSGKRFARFPVHFWRESAQHALDGEFEKIPAKPPVAPKPKKEKRPKGERAPRQARPPREPRDNKDLTALPTVGKTVAEGLQAAGINTFAQLANASEAKLREVAQGSGPKYKTFDVNYWKTVAKLAKDGSLDYPPPPRKEKKEKTGRKGRAPKEVQPTDLRRLAGVGKGLEAALRRNGLETFQDIVDAEPWRISKAGSEAGRRFANIDPEQLKRAARDATNGKFPEKGTRSVGSKLPEGADNLREIKNIGKGVQAKLFERGILTYKDLANASIGVLESVRDEVGKRVAKTDVRKWKELARHAVNGDWHKVNPAKYEDSSSDQKKRNTRPEKPKDGDDLTKIKGIGPQAQQYFRNRGVKTYSDLIQLPDDMLMHYIEESGARIAPEDFEKVRTSAAKQMSKSHG